MVARARLEGNALNDVSVIFGAKPALPARALFSNFGGRIAIGRDGDLFATIGDRSKSPPWLVAQQLDTHLGKMISHHPATARLRRQSLYRQARRAAGNL